MAPLLSTFGAASARSFGGIGAPLGGTPAELGTATTLGSGENMTQCSLCRIGDTDKFAFLYFANDLKRIYGRIITFDPSDNSFTSSSEQALITSGHSAEPINPSATYHPNSGRIVFVGQGNSYYPYIYSMELQNNNSEFNTGSRKQGIISSNDSNMFHSGGRNIIHHGGNNFVGVCHKSNTGQRVYTFTVGNTGSIDMQINHQQLDGGHSGYNRADSPSLIYDGTTYHYFYNLRYQYAANLRHVCFTYDGSSIGNEDGYTVSTGDNETRNEGAFYLPNLNKIVWVTTDSYDNIHYKYIRKVRFFDPDTSGDRLANVVTRNLSNDINSSAGFADTNGIACALEPVSENIIFMEGANNGQIAAMKLDSSGAFEEMIDLGTYTGTSVRDGQQLIARPHDDDFSIFVVGHNTGTAHYARTIRGKS